MEEIRINKYIAMCGVCSRRKADMLIEEGHIKINDSTTTNLGLKVGEKDIVKVDNKIIKMEEKMVYYILNKPKGYVTTVKDQFKRKSVVDLIKEEERIYPIGRLDMYSEGLLILTNDGEFTNKITHPSKHIAKTYIVNLDKDIESTDINKLENGIDIGGYITAKSIVKKINNKNIQITIFEGKNRQIRKMCETIGYNVINLKRISIGKLSLENLKTGEYKKVSYEDISKVFE